MDSGLWRIKWETRNENPPGKGTFKVIVHSDVSGRPLMQAVEHRGAGHGIAYVAEDPRLYFLVIESTNLDWTVAVEESVTGEARIGRPAVSWSFASYLHPVGGSTAKIAFLSQAPLIFWWGKIKLALRM